MNEFDVQTNPAVHHSPLLAQRHGLLEKAAALLDQEPYMKRTQQQGIIICKNGIYTIRADIETSGIAQDAALKQLIDAVLR